MNVQNVIEGMKKKKLLSVLPATGVILIAVIAGIAIYNTPANRLSRQMDLGNRYLEEGNYEHAVIAFDEAISIDPMSAEAYIGKAGAYLGMDDYEQAAEVYVAAFAAMPDSEKMKDAAEKFFLDYAKKYIDSGNIERAVSILEEGYKLTGRESLHNKAEKLRQEEEVKKEEAKREEENSRWKNPRIEVDEETQEFISQMIDLCEQENYEEVSNILLDERCIGKLNNYSSVINGINRGKTINTFCSGYSVYISAADMVPEGNTVDFVCIPKDGRGYMVYRELGTGQNDIRWDSWGYLICPVVEYKLNGSFYSYYNTREGGHFSNYVIAEGELKDNYLDGEIYVKADNYSWSQLYDNGHMVSYGNEDGRIIYKKVYDSNGEVRGDSLQDFEREKEYQRIPGTPISESGSHMFLNVAPWD